MMNKSETVWLIVRVAGIYLIYSAIVTVASFYTSASNLYSLSNNSIDAQPSANANISSPYSPVMPFPEPVAQKPLVVPGAEKAKSDAFKLALWYLFLTLAQLGVGIYLARYGSILFKLLAREGGGSNIKREPEVVTLDL